MKVLSLFDGISCGMIALERAGISVERYVAYEIDKYAIQISKKNYPQIEQKGDVTTGDFTQYKGFDLLIGGSPCTYWSIAKKGRETTSSGEGWDLFMHYKRALKESGCKYFLYENNYSIHKDIKAEITKQLGVEPIIINSALVSAQQRKRCYWTNIPNVEQPKDRLIYLEDIVEPDALVDRDKAHAIIASIGRTTHREYFLKNQGQLVFVAVMLSNVYGGFKENKPRVHINKSITVRTGQGGGNVPSLIIEGEEKTFSLEEFKKYIRKITPLEGERLQTLPDNYTEGISNTQRYKCIGNGWTVVVIAHILKEIKEA